MTSNVFMKHSLIYAVYAAFVREVVHRIKNNISIGQLLTREEAEAFIEELTESLAELTLPDGKKLTVEDMYNFKTSEELEKKWNTMGKRKYDDYRDTKIDSISPLKPIYTPVGKFTTIVTDVGTTIVFLETLRQFYPACNLLAPPRYYNNDHPRTQH